MSLRPTRRMSPWSRRTKVAPAPTVKLDPSGMAPAEAAISVPELTYVPLVSLPARFRQDKLQSPHLEILHGIPGMGIILDWRYLQPTPRPAGTAR